MFIQKKVLLIASLLLSINAIQAAPILDTPAPADHYKCVGKNATFVLSKNINGVNSFNLTLDGINYKVKDPSIDTESTLLGDIKEVTIGFRPDVSITKASVIIPSILLGPDVPHLKFNTQLAITTVIKSMIMGAPQGISNKSTYIHLVCKATVRYP